MTLSTLRSWLISAAVLVLGASAAAQVSGKLLLGSLKRTAPAEPRAEVGYNWELENGIKEVRGDGIDVRREFAVVVLSDAQPKAGAEPPRAEAVFSGGDLLPSTIVVRSGTTLLIRNDDEIAHELYAPGLEGLGAEPTTPRGRRSISLKTAGHWPLRDRLLPHVAGHLYVLPNLVAVATQDASGQFSFTDLEPGSYTLKVFRGDKELASRPIELTSRSLSLDPIALGASSETK